MEITEVLGYKDGEIMLNPLYIFEETGEDSKGMVIGSLKRTENPLVNRQKAKQRGIDLE